MKPRLGCIALSVALVGSGCAVHQGPGSGGGSAYTPVIDLQGADQSRYSSDLTACRSLAQQAEAAAVQNAVGAALFAGALSAAISPRGYRTDMANYGGTIAGAQSFNNTSAAAKQMVINCMAGRGYRTLEVTLPAQAYSSQVARQIEPTAPALSATPSIPAPLIGTPTRAATAPEPRIGPDSRLVEAMTEAKACNPRPIAILVGQALASQSNYTVACTSGDSLLVRCEYGTCRALR